jgi:hypothetical protein
MVKFILRFLIIFCWLLISVIFEWHNWGESILTPFYIILNLTIILFIMFFSELLIFKSLLIELLKKYLLLVLFILIPYLVFMLFQFATING